MRTNIHHSPTGIGAVSARESPPYVVFHIQTPTGRRYQIDGEGFVTPDPDEATRYHVSEKIRHFHLKGVPIGTRSVHCSAPLLITTTSADQVEVYWGRRRLLLCPDHLVAQAGRLVWAELEHFYQGGYPFGPVVRIVTDEPEHKIAIFNIEIHPPPGQLGFLHQAPADWDATPRKIMTHLGILGFSSASSWTKGDTNTIWCRPLAGACGELWLETGSGALVERLTVDVVGQPICTISATSRKVCHNSLHDKLVALIEALESPATSGRSANVASLIRCHFHAA
jgi:hypothetical protein